MKMIKERSEEPRMITKEDIRENLRPLLIEVRAFASRLESVDEVITEPGDYKMLMDGCDGIIDAAQGILKAIQAGMYASMYANTNAQKGEDK